MAMTTTTTQGHTTLRIYPAFPVQSGIPDAIAGSDTGSFRAGSRRGHPLRHPADLLLLAGSVFSLGTACINFAWLRESGPAPDGLDWRTRLRVRGRRHPVLTKVQYTCMILAFVLFAAYGVALFAR